MKLLSGLIGDEVPNLLVLKVDILIVRCKIREGSYFRQHFFCSVGSNRTLGFLLNLIVQTVSNFIASFKGTINHFISVFLQPIT